MQGLQVGKWSQEEIVEALHANGRTIAFRFDLLDKNNDYIRSLDKVLKASVHYNALADIKRTAKFEIEDDESINYLSDRIRPWFRLYMGARIETVEKEVPKRSPTLYDEHIPYDTPNLTYGGLSRDVQEEPDVEVEVVTIHEWAEWPLGIFLLSTPKRSVTSADTPVRKVEAYDQSIILVDDKFTNRFTLSDGTNVIAAINIILLSAGISLANVVDSDDVLPVSKDWKPGTSKTKIINELLSSINYRSHFFDANGYFIGRPYQNPSNRPTEYTYETNNKSLILPDAESEFDLYDVPNEWVAVVSEPDRPPLVSQYTNDNPMSPTSTVSRGRTITRIVEEQEATSQAKLDEKVERLAFESSQIYEVVSFTTALMPHHGDSDLIELYYPKLAHRNRYVEHTWDMELRAGAKMKHKIRRVVSV